MNATQLSSLSLSVTLPFPHPSRAEATPRGSPLTCRGHLDGKQQPGELVLLAFHYFYQRDKCALISTL